jgi:DNA-binding NarL/FixJ family response regulator
MTDILRTIIADDHQMFVEALSNLFNNCMTRSFKVVATTPTGEDVSMLLRRWKPHLLILDMNMPIKDGLAVLVEIKDKYPDTRIIILTMYDDPKLLKETMNLGAHAYVLKTDGFRQLLDAVNSVLDNTQYVSETLRRHVPMEDDAEKTIHSRFEDKFITKYNLTKRELEILRLIAQALNNKQIGKELYISDQTVGVHRKNIMRKLSVNSTASLVKVAYEYKLI